MARIKKTSLAPQADLALEISWEVCNKIGGINTVLATKAAQMVKHYHSGYIMIGPYFPDNSKYQFEESQPEGRLKEIFDSLEGQGIKCHFGKWLIEGEPPVILVDFQNLWPNVNRYKWELWDSYKIDSMGSAFDFDEPVVWSYSVGQLMEQIGNTYSGKKIVAHFHEWMAGIALLFAKKNFGGIASIFTTHATTIGRSLAFNNIDFYSAIDKIDPLKEAYNYGVQAKHLAERAAASNCTIFTTVSEITGVECQYFLGRIPDVFLPNGLDVSGYSSFEEVAIKHRAQRARIREFLFYNFFSSYTFDLKNTLFYFLMARYEYHAKGIDVFVKALGRLNQRLVKENSKKTIVAFFWVPSQTKGIQSELIEKRGNYFDIKQFVEENSTGLVESFMYSLVAGKDLRDTDVFDPEPRRELERKLKKMRRGTLPAICTHDLERRDDMILQSLVAAGLNNKKDDRVKAVFYPAYLNETDKLLNLNVREAIQGCHLGVFPSYYEPWGYTPLEAAAEGVAAITGDLSGVGRFIKKLPRDKQHPGIFIIDNFGKNEDEIVAQLEKILYDYANLSRADRVENKIKAREMVNYFDWENLVDNYIEAHNKALECQKEDPGSKN